MSLVRARCREISLVAEFKSEKSDSRQVTGVVDRGDDRATVGALNHGQGTVLDQKGKDAVARPPDHVEDGDLDHAAVGNAENVTVRVALMDAAQRANHPL